MLPVIFIIDINGHFITAVNSVIDSIPTLVVYNTMKGNTLGGDVIPAAFDFVFPCLGNLL